MRKKISIKWKNQWEADGPLIVIAWQTFSITYVIFGCKRDANLNLIMSKHQTEPKWKTFHLKNKWPVFFKMSVLQKGRGMQGESWGTIPDWRNPKKHDNLMLIFALGLDLDSEKNDRKHVIETVAKTGTWMVDQIQSIILLLNCLHLLTMLYGLVPFL